jgi:hypothetical protein
MCGADRTNSHCAKANNLQEGFHASKTDNIIFPNRFRRLDRTVFSAIMHNVIIVIILVIAYAFFCNDCLLLMLSHSFYMYYLLDTQKKL